jgi:hypothetical protein
MINSDLLKSYNSADYHVDASPSFILKIGIHSAELKSIYKTSDKHTAAFITTSNLCSRDNFP